MEEEQRRRRQALASGRHSRFGGTYVLNNVSSISDFDHLDLKLVVMVVEDVDEDIVEDVDKEMVEDVDEEMVEDVEDNI